LKEFAVSSTVSRRALQEQTQHHPRQGKATARAGHARAPTPTTPKGQKPFRHPAEITPEELAKPAKQQE
jgi:hypothetical protein